MVYRLILDENVEHERLENYGYDVEHIDYAAELGRGPTTDQSLGTLERPTGSSSPSTTISPSNSVMTTTEGRSTSPTQPCRPSRLRT